MQRKILHVDMDAFFASIEILDNPQLKGKPVIVGSDSERGVVTTCSYEARKYGVKSAMPSYKAKALCPSAIFVPVRIYRYREISNKVFDILHEFADNIEKVSIDEAYIDISSKNIDSKKFAFLIKAEIKNRLGLTISVGISYNKFLAKIASDWNKPNGLMEITQENVVSLLTPLNISKVHGLGKKSVIKLNNIGIYTIGDMYSLPKHFFKDYFGKAGEEIYKRIRGIDEREVINVRERKSFGREITLRQDTLNRKELNNYLKDFAKKIELDLLKNNLRAKTITLKIRDNNFETHTKSKTFSHFFINAEEIYIEGCNIFNSININKPIRLIGLTVSSIEERKIEQISIFNML